jgi:hypothetical protein
MAAATKRRKAAKEKVDSTKVYVIDEALSLVKELATAKFPESIDVSVNLGVDPRKSDQVVRGSTVLPNGTGKTVRVAVFAQGENADKAKAAGADVVGFEDLAETVKGGELNFDVVIATRPDAEPQGGHGNRGRRDRGEECEGRPGALSDRQGRHHSLPDRPRRLRSTGTQGKPPGSAGRPEEGEAGSVERTVRKEIDRLLDHGSRRVRGPGFGRRLIEA